MLPPDQRHLFLDLLRPPLGFDLAEAIGTTFTLDLHSLMQVPVAFVHQAGLLTEQDNDERRELGIIDGLRRYADRLTVFAQECQIKLPTKLPRLAALLEPCVVPVHAPREGGVFHPKLWVLRFAPRDGNNDERVRYRVLCLSRNLTFDRSWDTCLALDGVLRAEQVKVRGNGPLAEFVEALPGMSGGRMAKERQRAVLRVADELRRVEFDRPEGFEAMAFHHWGLAGSKDPLPNLQRAGNRALVISPFLSASVLQRLAGEQNVTLISRGQALDQLSNATLAPFRHRLFVMHDQSAGEPADDDDDAELAGLHAKVFVFDDGWNAHVLTGSCNATHQAMHKNVEFMVQLTGKRSLCGVEATLPPPATDAKSKVRSLRDLLTPYRLDDREDRPDSEDDAWDQLCLAAREAVAAADFALTLVERDGLFDLQLQARGSSQRIAELEVCAWPAALPGTHAQTLVASDVIFTGLTFDAVTAWMAFEVRQSGRRSAWVAKVELLNSPEDRVSRIMASLIDSREKLIRLLLLMLRLDEDAFADEGAGAGWIDKSATGHAEQPPLLEMLLRAAHQTPQTIQRIDALIRDLQGSAALQDEALMKVWKPIREALGLP